MTGSFFAEGGCDCRHVRYRMQAPPLFVHCCHCRTPDHPDLLPPDIHIFTASKQPWVVLAPGTPAMLGYYDREQHWPAESLARRAALLAG